MFVANRVAETLNNTQSHQWNHCPGETNPADDGTRGIPFRDFHSNTRWFQGHEFLKQPVSQWPSNPVHPQMTAMRCTRRTSQKNCFHAIDDTTDIANDNATDVDNNDATDVANDDATDVANDDATDVANEDATDVAKNFEAAHTKCLRNVEVATHNSDAAAVLAEEDDEEEAEDEEAAAEILKVTEVAIEDSVGTDAAAVATVSTTQCAMEHVTIASTFSTNTASQTHSVALPSSSSIVQQDIFQTLEVDRFSSRKRLVRVTAFVLRAITKFKGLRFRFQTPTNITNCRNVTPLPTKFQSSSFRSLSPRHAVPFPSADEMSNAKTFLLLASQKESFQNEIRSLSNKTFIAPKSRLRNLKSFLDADNCLRAEGRLHKSPFDYCLKHPIILDGHNRIIQLFIEFVHSSNGHTRLKQTQHILQL